MYNKPDTCNPKLLACLVGALFFAFHVHAFGDDATVSGTVTDADTGLPVEGALVAAFGSDGNSLVNVTTGPGGNYQLEISVDGNDEQVVFMRAGSDNYVSQAWEGVSCELDSCPILASDPIALQSGQDKDAVDFTLAPGATLTGTLRPEGINKSVRLWSAAGQFLDYRDLLSGTEDWSFDGLAGGSYYLSFFGWGAEGSRYIRILHNGLFCPWGGCHRARGEPITVDTGATRAGVDVELEIGGTVSGALVDTQGDPIPFAADEPETAGYDVIDIDGNVVGGGDIVENVDGEAVLRASGTGIPPGEYFVRTHSEWWGLSIGYGHGGADAVAPGFIDSMYPNIPCVGRSCDLDAATTVVIEQDENTEIEIAVVPGSTITGSVVDDATDDGISRGVVKLVEADNTLLAATYTDENGDFLLGGFPEGSYFLRTSMSGGTGPGRFGFQNPYFDTVHGADENCSEALCDPAMGAAVELDGSTDPDPIELRVTPGPVIRGQIIDTLTGLVIAWGRVEVFDDEGNFVGSYRVTSSDGQFQTTALSPGTYTVIPEVSPAFSGVGVDAPDQPEALNHQFAERTSDDGSAFTVEIDDEDVEIIARVVDKALDRVFHDAFGD